MAGLSLGGPGNSAFSFGSALGNLVSTPASPSRLLAGPSNSPFPLMSMPLEISDVCHKPPRDTSLQCQRLDRRPSPKLDAKLSRRKSKMKPIATYSESTIIRRNTLSIDEVLDMLQRFKECMLRNLFEEYKFFPQYSDKELQITAQLFGGMVERNLVTTYVALGLALRCVLDALKKQEGSKMYYFGITALDRFKNKLHLYPKYYTFTESHTSINSHPIYRVSQKAWARLHHTAISTLVQIKI